MRDPSADLARVVGALLDAKVDFVVIGGAALYSLPKPRATDSGEIALLATVLRVTADVDIAAFRVDAAIAALRGNGFWPIDSEHPTHLVDGPATVDVVHAEAGSAIDVGVRDRTTLHLPVGALEVQVLEVAGRECRVATPASLIVLKAISSGDPERSPGK